MVDEAIGQPEVFLRNAADDARGRQIVQRVQRHSRQRSDRRRDTARDAEVDDQNRASALRVAERVNAHGRRVRADADQKDVSVSGQAGQGIESDAGRTDSSREGFGGRRRTIGDRHDRRPCGTERIDGEARDLARADHDYPAACH